MYHVADIPTTTILGVALVLFVTGLGGVLMRRNLFYVLLSLEIMLNAAALAFVAAGARWRAPEAQIMVVLVLTAAAAEVAVGASLLLRLDHRVKTLDSDEMSTLRD